MTAPLTAGWSGLVVSGGNLDSTTYGQGTSFPSTYSITRLFWRSDLGRMYYNKGTSGTPVWEGSDVPIGTINMYAGAVADIPSGWLLCNGTAVSRTTYSELFDRLDNEYGIGDGSTTFNLPDFATSNIFPRGATNNAGRGTTGGESTHLLTSAESGLVGHGHSVSITDPGHTHTAIGGGSSTNNGTTFRNHDASFTTLTTESSTTGISASAIAVSNANASSSHENKPPFLDVHFIIAV